MEFRMLGPLAVEVEGREVALGGKRQRTVLALLLARANKVVSTDTLIDELYGEDPPEAARKSLQSYVANLRRAINIDGELLRGRSPGYILEVESRHVDALSFETQVLQARSLLSSDPVTAGRHLTDALDLWYGVPLVDVADEAPTLRNLAGRLDEMRRTAVELRIDAYLALGRHVTLIPELENLTTQYPLHERFWAQLMLALYRSGRQADALRTYQRARRLLADEMGIDPSPELQDLEQRILDQDEQLGASGEALDAPAAMAPEPGGTIHGYELRRLVFEAGSTRLFRAYHAAIGREVGVEVVTADAANAAEFARAFGPRAAAIARLEHPHLVPLLDYWREPGSAYLVSRWYEGGTLTDALRSGPWTHEAVFQLAEQIGPALAVAHRGGVFHGRLDPSTVMLDQARNAYLGRFRVDAPGSRIDGSQDVADLARLLAVALAGEDLSEAGLAARAPAPVAALLSGAVTDPLGNVEEFLADLRTAAGEGLFEAPQGHQETATNPYKGLRAFSEADAPDFFGRERLIGRLLEHLDESGDRFVAIVGPSGSGKSSVARAGLMASLREGALPGSESWFIAEMRPGSSPFEELETALLRVAVNPPATLLEQLERDIGGVSRALKRVLPGPEAELLLFVDQFEELFTLASKDERDRFVESLVYACDQPNPQVRIVAAMRADFYDRPLAHRALAGTFTDHMETVHPLTPDELDHAIAGPAERVGVAVNPDLEAQIVADVADQPGALPLLQYAMTELFDRQSDARLTLDAYQDIGGLSGALARRAESLFQSFDADRQASTREMMLRLVRPGATGGATRRRVTRAELTGIEDRRDVEAVIEAFASARLLTLDHDPATRAPIVEIGHDALLNVWPRLRSWIDAAQEDLRLGRRLAAAAVEWSESGEDDGYLLAGSRLAQYEIWSEGAGVALTGSERRFLDRSLQQRDAVEASELHRRQRELELESRSANRLRVLVAVLAVAAAVAAVLSVVARGQAQRAEHNLAISTGRALTSEAVTSLEVDPELSILLALEATQTVQTVDEAVLRETVEVLHRAVLADRMLMAVQGGAGGFSPDGSRLVTADSGTVLGGGPADGRLTVWDATTGEEILALSGHADRTTGATFDSTGRLIASASLDTTARIWNAADGTLLHVLADHSGGLTSVAFTPDSSELVTGALDGTVRRWDASTGSALAVYTFDDIVTDVAPAPDGRLGVALDVSGAVITDPDGVEQLRLSGHAAAVCSVVFGHGGSLIATGSQDGTVRIWDAASGDVVHVIEGHSGPACGVDFSSDGATLATGGEDGTARVWDLATGQQRLTLYGHQAGIATVRLSPDGRLLSTASGDATTRVWEVTAAGSRQGLVFAGQGAPVTVAELSADGTRLFTGGEDGSGMLWDATDGRLLHRLEGHTGRVFGAAFNGAGSLLATSSEDRTVWIWDVETGAARHVLVDHRDTVWSVQFSAAGDVLVTGSLDSTVRAWDVETWAATTLDLSGRGIFSVGFDPTNDLLYAIGEGIGVFEADTLAPRFTLDNDQAATLDHAFSPDGGLLAAAGSNGTIILYRVEPASDVLLTEVRVLAGHTGAVLDVAFSPDGTLLASSSLDNSVKLWTVDGEEVLSLPSMTTPGRLAFTVDGSRLAVSGADGATRMLVVSVDELYGIAMDRVSRGLTAEECDRYAIAGCPVP